MQPSPPSRNEGRDATEGDTVAESASNVSRRIAIDSVWILLGYAVTSGSGFLFWVVAARMIPPEQLGIDTAIYAILTAAASIAASGVGDALLVMLPLSGAARSRLFHLGVRTDVIIGAIAGLAAGIVAATTLRVGIWPIAVVILIAVATIVQSLFVIKDPVLQSLGKASSTLPLNGGSNVAKLLLLPVLGLLFAVTDHLVLVAILAPVTFTVLAAYARVIPRALRSASDAPGGSHDAESWMRRQRRPFAVFVARDGIASALYLGLFLTLPFAVTGLAGPAQGAMFALCIQLATVLDLVALAVGASFSTHAAAAGGTTPVIKVWLRVLAVVTVAGLGLSLLSPLLLGFMRPFYVQQGGVLVIVLLVCGSVVRTSYEMWGASQRARHKTTALLAVNGSQAIVLVSLSVTFIPMWGAVGAAIALLIATACTSVVGTIGLLRAPTIAR